jgi:hypothetical protein
MVNATPRPLYPRERDPVSIVQEAGWAPGSVWTAAKNLAPTGIRSPDRQIRFFVIEDVLFLFIQLPYVDLLCVMATPWIAIRTSGRIRGMGNQTVHRTAPNNAREHNREKQTRTYICARKEFEPSTLLFERSKSEHAWKCTATDVGQQSKNITANRTAYRTKFSVRYFRNIIKVTEANNVLH